MCGTINRLLDKWKMPKATEATTATFESSLNFTKLVTAGLGIAKKNAQLAGKKKSLESRRGKRSLTVWS